MSEYQCGGRRGRGTSDNQIMMNAVIDNNRRLRRKTYVYYADAYKCFDKLWLKDCLVELWKAGMREREVRMIYEMNKTANIIISTPMGKTEEIQVKDIVRQGTIFGPKLCCISTQKINNRIEPLQTRITPELTIGAPVYVDDILAMGSKDTVEAAIRNTRMLEERKKFKFNRTKSKYMVINTGRETEVAVNESVKDGVIEKIDEYKYLGVWMTEDNKILRQIEVNKARLQVMIKDIQRIGSINMVGSKNTEIRQLLYESVVLPTILYNVEVMGKLSRKEIEELEKLQKTALTRIYELPESTPYWGILIETGLWPLEYRLMYKRLMLYRDLIMSSNERVAKNIMQQQKKYALKGCLYEEIENNANELGIDLNVIDTLHVLKSEWKKIVKRKIEEKVASKAKIEAGRKTKLRLVKDSGFGEKEYVKSSTIEEISKIMRMRLNMCKIGANYGKPGVCKLCKNENESTEHMLTCKVILERVASYKGAPIDKCIERKEALKAAEFIEKASEALGRMEMEDL